MCSVQMRHFLSGIWKAEALGDSAFGGCHFYISRGHQSSIQFYEDWTGVLEYGIPLLPYSGKQLACASDESFTKYP